MAGKMKVFASKQELENLYNKYKSAYKIAELYSVNYKTVYNLMKYYDINQNVGSQGARKFSFNEKYFYSIDTPEKAYWLGFIMADGCVYKGSDKFSYRLQINLNSDDIDHLNNFQKEIESNYKIQIKNIKNHSACLLKVNSTQMCKDLINHGVIERKSIVCKMPVIDKSLVHHFIRGYFDGDGCLTVSRNCWTFKIAGGEDMLLEIKKYLPELTTLYQMKNSSIKSLQTSKIQSVINILNWLYKDSNENMRLKRKYNKYMSLLSELRESP